MDERVSERRGQGKEKWRGEEMRLTFDVVPLVVVARLSEQSMRNDSVDVEHVQYWVGVLMETKQREQGKKRVRLESNAFRFLSGGDGWVN